jgi:hypothetical protein
VGSQEREQTDRPATADRKSKADTPTSRRSTAADDFDDAFDFDGGDAQEVIPPAITPGRRSSVEPSSSTPSVAKKPPSPSSSSSVRNLPQEKPTSKKVLHPSAYDGEDPDGELFHDPIDPHAAVEAAREAERLETARKAREESERFEAEKTKRAEEQAEREREEAKKLFESKVSPKTTERKSLKKDELKDALEAQALEAKPATPVAAEKPSSRRASGDKPLPAAVAPAKSALPPLNTASTVAKSSMPSPVAPAESAAPAAARAAAPAASSSRSRSNSRRREAILSSKNAAEGEDDEFPDLDIDESAAAAPPATSHTPVSGKARQLSHAPGPDDDVDERKVDPPKARKSVSNKAAVSSKGSRKEEFGLEDQQAEEEQLVDEDGNPMHYDEHGNLVYDDEDPQQGQYEDDFHDAGGEEVYQEQAAAAAAAQRRSSGPEGSPTKSALPDDSPEAAQSRARSLSQAKYAEAQEATRAAQEQEQRALEEQARVRAQEQERLARDEARKKEEEKKRAAVAAEEAAYKQSRLAAESAAAEKARVTEIVQAGAEFSKWNAGVFGAKSTKKFVRVSSHGNKSVAQKGAALRVACRLVWSLNSLMSLLSFSVCAGSSGARTLSP